MKKLLLASVFAIASFPGYAATSEEYSCHEQGYARGTADFDQCMKRQADNSDVDEVPHLGDTAKSRAEADECHAPEDNCIKGSDGYYHRPQARVTVAPPYQGPPPIGWIYAPYTQCGDPPRCSMGVVSVAADGLNVRVTPNGPPVMALVNGTPVIPVGRQGPWLLVAAGCDLTPTFAWSWTAGVPLNRCWVYF